MTKTLKIAGAVAAVLCAASPALAGTPGWGNGVSLNGVSLNGISLNGEFKNGISLNGISLNGEFKNGVDHNGEFKTRGVPHANGLNLQSAAGGKTADPDPAAPISPKVTRVVLASGVAIVLH